jgi:hypothetical protein
MARWALFLTDSMTAAIDLLLRTETAGFELHSLFFHDLHDAQIERAPACRAIDRTQSDGDKATVLRRD